MSGAFFAHLKHLVMLCIITTDSRWYISNSYMHVDNLSSFEYFRKIVLTTSVRKPRRGRGYNHLYIFLYDTTPAYSEEQHRPSKQTGTIITLSFRNQPCTCPPSGLFCKQDPFLVVKQELIWLLFLNIFSFNFVRTQKKSLRFRRLRTRYVNCPVIVSTNDCQSFRAFFFFFCLTCAV